MIIEKSFPRGGVPAKESTQATNKRENIIFGAVQKKIKKSKTKPVSNEIEDLEKKDVIEAHTAELLSYDTVQDGMNIMGIVAAADDVYLTISLPGRMTARISALDISDAYTKAAKEHLESSVPNTNYKTLGEIYEIGQLVYARVQQVKHDKYGRVELAMSLKPAEVHADLLHSNVRKGFIFNGAIEEIQEHGYIIETGIKGLRCFLPADKAQKELALGQLVFVKVEKITIDKSASTCICKQLQADQLTVKSLQSENSNIDYILPGTMVKFQVTKCLKNGLQGTIMNEAFTAYVNEHQLAEPLMLPEDYEIKGKYEARILYVMPLTKLVYLTLNLRTESAGQAEDKLKRGDIVEKAKVHHLGTGGVVLVLNNSLKGLISYKTIKANYKGNYDQDELLSKYAKKSKHKVRILDYDMMDALYICSDDANIVNEKTFAIDDLKPGEFVTAVIKGFNKKTGGYDAHVGKVNAIIDKLFLATSGGRHYEPKSKVRCRVIALNADRNKAYLSNRAEYLDKDCKLLTNLDAAKKNEVFMGTIVKETETYYLVKFCNDIVGLLFKSHLRDPLQSEHSAAQFNEGQTMLFRIYSRNDERISLALVDEISEMGEICDATVTHVLETGLEIDVRHKTKQDSEEEKVTNSKGIVPIRLLSDFMDLLHAKTRICNVNTAVKAICMHKNIFSLRDVAYFEAHGVKTLDKIKPGDILRAYVENVNDEMIEIFVLGYNKLVKVHFNMLLLKTFKNANVVLHPEQVVFVKVLSKEAITKTITVSALLTEVWDQKFTSVAEYAESYLQEVSDIQKAFKKRKTAIAQFNVGDKIELNFQGIDSETQNWLYEHKKSKVLAIAKASLMADAKMKPPKTGAPQQAIILWIDYSSELLLISPKPGDIKHITNASKMSEELLTAKQANAKVLLKLEHIFICSLKKGPNPLVYCPTRLHYNDFEMAASRELKEGDFCKLAFIHKSKPIAVLNSIWELWHEKGKNFKRKAETVANVSTQIEAKAKKLKETPTEKTTEKTAKQSPLKKSAKKDAASEEPKAKKAKKVNEILPLESTSPLFYEDKTPTAVESLAKHTEPKKSLAGVTNFWNTDLTQLSANQQTAESSDDDDDDAVNATETAKQKKKKLSAVEKFKQQREEETRLREIEEKYADPSHLPETVDQFDRLVLSAPNDSKNWINYMVFHLQSAEIDKARAVAKRAVKVISMRNADDHLNVWVALLNLELRYGSKETFDSTLKEALTYNEPLKVYLRVVDILREAKKNQELIEIVSVITKRFKTEQNVWKSAADAYFSVGMVEQAQQMLHKSLSSLPEREHVNTIVMFANLNHRHGCSEMAQTLLDQVVTSYPKRVDVWTQYVDMLVKDQLVDSARNVLERAILQKIPLKKMRTIFKKYLEFEERHGTEADVEKVKKLATEYVKNNANVEI